MDSCIFCKIAKREIPKEFLIETEDFMVFADIYPSAPVHYLAVPKKHIPSVTDINQENETVAGKLVRIAKEAAEKLGLDGYKLVFNVGKEGGQIVDHLHLHILGGWGKNNANSVNV